MSPLTSCGYVLCITTRLVLSSGLCTWQSTSTKLSIRCVTLCPSYSDCFSCSLILHSLYQVTRHFRYPASPSSGWTVKNCCANNCSYFKENNYFDIKNAALIRQMVHDGKELLIKWLEMEENSDKPAAVAFCNLPLM